MTIYVSEACWEVNNVTVKYLKFKTTLLGIYYVHNMTRSSGQNITLAHLAKTRKTESFDVFRKRFGRMRRYEVI